VKVQEVEDYKAGPPTSVPSTHQATYMQSKLSSTSPEVGVKPYSKTTLEPSGYRHVTSGSFLNSESNK